MKKILILSLALALTFCACKKTEETSNTLSSSETPESTAETVYTTDITEKTESTVTTIPSVVTTSLTTEVTTTPVVTTEEPAVTTSTPVFEIHTERFTPNLGQGISVEYEVAVFEDEKVNDRVIAEAEKMLNNYDISSVKEFGGTAEYNVEVSSVYNGKCIISTVYTGNYGIYYDYREESGEILYPINIDTSTGRLIYSKDIISDFDKLIKAFENGEFESNYADVDENVLSNYGPNYGRYPDVSIDAENFYFYIREIEINEYYITYSIPLEKAKEFLNAKYLNIEE